MKGRPSLFDFYAIIKKAQKVFWTKGYTASSIDDLLQAMGIGSGSFYNAFKGGKKELFVKALQERRRDFKQFNDLLEKSDAPVDMIKDFFRSIAAAQPDDHKKGCIVANAVTEMALLDEQLEKEAIDILKEVEKLYTKIIRKAQEDGTLKTKIDPETLGRYLITLYNGLNVTRRMYPDKKQLYELIELQLKIIR
jgi:TetR/AcrR family transcriptional repressor of nem operon